MAANQPFPYLNDVTAIETVLTGAPPVVLPRAAASARDQADDWKKIEDRIARWAPTSGEPDDRMDEDGYILPTQNTVALALNIAARLYSGGVTVPGSVVQDGNGGVDFEWRSGNRAQTLSVNSRGETELIEFENSKLVSRKPISFAAAQR